jgi:hypothetical protein
MTQVSVTAAARRRSSSAAIRISATELPSRRVYQRINGTATVPVSGTYTGTPSAISARIINAVTSAEVVGWLTVADPSVSQFSTAFSSAFGAGESDTWNGTLSVPQGGWYKIQYRFADAPAAVFTSINTIGVGDIWVFAGESQQSRMSTLVSSPPTPSDRTVIFTGGTSWTLPGQIAGTGGNGVIKFLNLMTAATNTPQACIQASVDGTAITDWEVADSAYTNAVSRLTAVGGVSGILWHQGGTGIGNITRADYKARLSTLRSGLQAAATVSRFGLFPLMQRTPAAESDLSVQEIRRAHYEYLTENPTTINLGWVPDVPLADDVNQTASGSELIAESYAHALLHAMGIETVNALGPVITGASRSGATVTLTVQHRSGTALKINSGTVATGFQVLPRETPHSDASALAISSITLNPSAIVIALGADPATPVDVYHQYGRFDAASPVYDNTVSLGRTTGNALQPLITPVSSPAEAGAILNSALKLDGTTGHARYKITDGWYFPDADWTVGGWFRIDNPAGTASQYLISAGPNQAVQSFNLLMYEATESATNPRPGGIEVALRSEGAVQVIQGASNPANLENHWNLIIVQRAKATEILTIYSLKPGSNRTTVTAQTLTGINSIQPTTPPAVGTRVPPSSTSLRWLDGAVHSVFRMNGLLTEAEMVALARGDDLISDLGKSPQLYTKFNTLTSPIVNSGTSANAEATITGGTSLTSGPQFSVQTSAVKFDETSLKYTMAKTASHTLPAGDWTLGFMIALDDNAGTVAQYIYSTGNFFGAGCVNLFIGEAGYAAAANMMSFSLDDGAAAQDDEFFTPSLAARIDGNWYLWTIEHDSAADVLRIYYTPVNGVRVLFHTATLPNALSVITSPNATVTIGTRHDLPDTRYFGGKMHMAFQMDGRLTQAQMQDIARGLDMKTSLGLTPKWYHKFTSSATTLTDLSGNGNTATASGGPPVLVIGPTFTPNG